MRYPLLIAALLLMAHIGAADVPGTTLTDETVDVTIVVATTGDDATGAGSSISPYRTIAKALTVARGHIKPFISVGGDNSVPNPDAKRVKVLIKAGTYRENVESDIYQDSVKTLVIAGEVDARGRPATIMSGFDLWNDDAWANSPAGSDTWTHTWENDFGTTAWPTGFEDLPTDNQVATRREIIMIGNRLLEQRSTATGLTPECFAIDEGANRITVRTAMNPNSEVVEVGVRRNLLSLRRHSNLVLRNIQFEGAACTLWAGNYDSAVTVNSYSDSPWVENVLIENCRFEWNGGSGLTTSKVKKITVRGCTMVDNGGTGVSFSGSSYVRFEESTIARNWWRGLWGRQSGDIDAGSKNGDLYHALFKNLTVEGNLTRGLWFDVFSKDVTVEGCTVSHNWGDGIYYEIGQPGHAVRDCVIRDNGGAGIQVNATRGVAITGNMVANNIAGAINLMVGSRTESTTDRDTGAQVAIASTRDITITGNTLVSQSYRQDLVFHDNDSTYAPTLLATLTCNNNTYRQDAALFRKGFGSQKTFAEWKGLEDASNQPYGFDTNSTCSEPYRAAAAADGKLEVEWFEGAGGRNPSTAAALNLAADARYVRKAPIFRSLPPVCEGQRNVAGLSARVVRGWIVPTTSGSHRFWIAGGQHVSLRLSTTDAESGASQVATTSGTGSLARQWDANASQAVGARTLTAGQRYWFELVQTTDGTGGDAPKNQPLALAWSPPADGLRRHAREVVPRAVIAARPDGTLGTGTARRESWLGTFGAEIWQLTGNSSNPRPDYPNNWATRQELVQLEIGRNWSTQSGSRVRTTLVPTSSGSYTFWVASRGRSELWLSPNADPATRVKIAEVTGTGTAYRTWTTQGSQKSPPQALAAGGSYYLELIHKMDDAAEEDHASVAWSTNPDDTAPTIITSGQLRTVSVADVEAPPDLTGGGPGGGPAAGGGGGSGGGCGMGSTVALISLLAAMLLQLGAGRRRSR